MSFILSALHGFQLKLYHFRLFYLFCSLKQSIDDVTYQVIDRIFKIFYYNLLLFYCSNFIIKSSIVCGFSCGLVIIRQFLTFGPLCVFQLAYHGSFLNVIYILQVHGRRIEDKSRCHVEGVLIRRTTSYTKRVRERLVLRPELMILMTMMTVSTVTLLNRL